MATPEIVPGYTGEKHPDVFTIPPPQPKQKKEGQLTEEQLRQFFDKGFVVVKNLFTKEEIDPSRDACDKLVEELAQQLFKAGKIKDLYQEYGFERRLIMIEKEWKGAVILLIKRGLLPQAFRDLWGNEKLLNIIEQLVGPEVGASPNWNLRPKAPSHRETLVPWHQDSSYFDNDTYSHMLVTAWVPLVDSTKENGTLECVIGGQKRGIICKHKCCEDFYLMLDDDEMKKSLGVDMSSDVELCEVPYGGVLLFTNATPHRSIPNNTDKIRWSLDFRFQSSEKPWGFWGMKPGIPLRSAKNPIAKIDWDAYDAANRYDIMREFDQERHGESKEIVDEFDISLTGPHMSKYEIVSHNIHLEAYFKGEEEKKKNTAR